MGTFSPKPLPHCGVQTSKKVFNETPPRNIIKVKLLPHFRTVSALIDSGAACSVMELKLARKLKLEIRQTAEQMKIVTANESPMKQVGVVSVMIAMDDYVAECNFVVVERLHYPIILGIDTLRANHCIKNFNDSYVQVGLNGTQIPLTQYVCPSRLSSLDAEVQIPARTKVLARVRLTKQTVNGT